MVIVSLGLLAASFANTGCGGCWIGFEVQPCAEVSEFFLAAKREDLGGEGHEYSRIAGRVFGQCLHQLIGHELVVASAATAFLQKDDEFIFGICFKM